MKTIRVKSWHQSQGDYVDVNEADFDPEKHERYEAETGPVDIPEGWETLHWKTRVGLARRIAGGDDEITSDKANEIIAAEVARRAAEQQSQA